jgi:hypothetical protein
MPTNDTRAVPLRISIVRLPIGGRIIRIAWGSTTSRSRWALVRLRAIDASVWPVGIAWIAPRTISAP